MANVIKFGAARIRVLKTFVNWETRAFGSWSVSRQAHRSDGAGVKELVSKWNRWAGRARALKTVKLKSGIYTVRRR